MDQMLQRYLYAMFEMKFTREHMFLDIFNCKYTVYIRGRRENFSLLNVVWHVVTFVRHNTFVNEMFPGVAMSRDDLLFIEYRFSSELSFFFFFTSLFFKNAIPSSRYLTRFYLLLRDIFARNRIFK